MWHSALFLFDWETVLKQTFIIPLVKHAEEAAYSCVFLFMYSIEIHLSLFILAHGKESSEELFLTLCVPTFQGEIGEGGQKVNIYKLFNIKFWKCYILKWKALLNDVPMTFVLCV